MNPTLSTCFGGTACAVLCILTGTVGCGSPDGTQQTIEKETIEVEFTSRTPLDEPANHLTLLYRKPREELTLPTIGADSDTWYFDVYYTRAGEEDFTVSAMFVPGEASDLLYVDRNNDEDLTNDGRPLELQKRDESVSFEIVSPHDDRQWTRYRLRREPIWITEEQRVEVIDHFLDENGDLRPDPASHFSGGRTGFARRSGLFFFDQRVGLARGELPVDGGTVSIGVFDYDNNGLFDDPDDLVVVDRDGDGKLTVLMSAEAYQFDDAFLIGHTWYRLVGADRYGKSAVFQIVDPPEEAAYWLESERDHPAVKGVREGTLSPDFWAAEFEDVSHARIPIVDHRGDFLLLNFWGEWCGPCVAELPILAKAASQYEPSGLTIISFLESRAPDRAAAVLAGFDAKWPQVLLTDELKKRFRVGGYPTNLLILPDGRSYVRTAAVDESFFEDFIE